ncbi:MAG: hypothetical protein KKF33_06955 [Alphaproteobacteria bacterium]|nr:hypothetical protein [Alphaproteobacteria bacterium]
MTNILQTGPEAGSADAGKLRIYLLGPFQIVGPDGRDLTPRRHKANALLAMVAVAERGQRARSWLCSRLWSDRSQEQALGSLRQSLTDIRRAIGDDWQRYVRIDGFNVAIDFEHVWIDAVALRERGGQGAETEAGEFLEGIDVRDDEFEDWLTVERSYWQKLREDRTQVPAVQVPETIIHSLPAHGALTLSMGGHRIEIRIVDQVQVDEAAVA